MSLVLYQHPFALYCWKALIALYERDVPFTSELVEADRSALAAMWPPASIPLLVDDGVVVPESSIIVEHLDRHGDAPPLIPSDPDTALQARQWDRVVDDYVATPVQKIVGDACDPPTERTRTASLRPTPPSTSPTPRWIASSMDGTTTAGSPARTSRSPTAPRRPHCITPTSCIGWIARSTPRWPPTSIDS